MKGYVVKDGFPDTKPDLDEDEDIAEYRCYDSDAFRAVVDEYLSYPSGSQKREQFIKARKEYVKAVQEVSLVVSFISAQSYGLLLACQGGQVVVQERGNDCSRRVSIDHILWFLKLGLTDLIG